MTEKSEQPETERADTEPERADVEPAVDGVEVLDEVPDIGALYARAAMGAITPWGGGDTLPARTLQVDGVSVDHARLKDYADVCGFRFGDVLPSTLVHVEGFGLSVDLMTRKDFPFDLPGLVHLAQSITQHRPVRVGEVMTLRATVANLRPHRVGLQFETQQTALVDGEVVWEGVSTLLRRGDGRSRDGDMPGPKLDLALDPGALEVDVPEDTGRRYASVSGDRNPIHLHAMTAKAFGFPRAIAHGMWSMARVLAAMEGRVPDAHRLDVRFEKPVLLPARVAITSRRAEGGWDLALHDRSRRDDDRVVRHLAMTLREV